MPRFVLGPYSYVVVEIGDTGLEPQRKETDFKRIRKLSTIYKTVAILIRPVKNCCVIASEQVTCLTPTKNRPSKSTGFGRFLILLNRSDSLEPRSTPFA